MTSLLTMMMMPLAIAPPLAMMPPPLMMKKPLLAMTLAPSLNSKPL